MWFIVTKTGCAGKQSPGCSTKSKVQVIRAGIQNSLYRILDQDKDNKKQVARQTGSGSRFRKTDYRLLDHRYTIRLHRLQEQDTMVNGQQTVESSSWVYKWLQLWVSWSILKHFILINFEQFYLYQVLNYVWWSTCRIREQEGNLMSLLWTPTKLDFVLLCFE